MNMWGTQAAFPDLRLDDLFTRRARKLSTGYSRTNACTRARIRSTTPMRPNTEPAEAEAQQRLPLGCSALVQGSVAPVRPQAPVVIYWGTKDTVMPPIMGKLYQQQMCKLGGAVERVQLAGEQTHFSTPGAAEPLYLDWIKDRLAGKPVTAACQGG